MAETQNQKPLDFMKYRFVYFAISALVIIPGIISLVTKGLRPSIDFTGGTLIELRFPEAAQVSEDVIRQSLPETIEVPSIQSTADQTYVLRAKPLTAQQNEELKSSLSQPFGQVEEIRFETVGPTLGAELVRKTLTAVALAAIAILLYIAYRFKDLKYGISAILAMFHDTFILLGVFSLLGYFLQVEVDTLFVTAVLTILSFSVHDTIVVYDRIRESLHRHPSADFTQLVNQSISETLARSINNSMTIIFMLLALYLMGGETTKWFVFALLIGTITGTYSSTFTAAPILVVWDNLSKRKR